MVRQLTRSMPLAIDHPVLLQSVGGSQVADKPNLPQHNQQRPTLLKRTDQHFIKAILAELRSEAGVQALKGRIDPIDPRQVLHLFQPVQRTFYVVMQEAVCDAFELPQLQPRLDSQKIESAGIVVRRIAIDPLTKQEQIQAWRRSPEGVLGWMPLQNDADLDPDPTRRSPMLKAGHPVIDRLLSPAAVAPEESVAPLFIAPPDICQATGRTLLYGVVPVTSPEVSEAPPTPPIPETAELSAQVDAAIRDLLPYYLRPQYVRPDTLSSDQQRVEPNGKAVLTASNANFQANHKTQQGRSLNVFISSLQQLKLHFNLFDNTPTSQALFAELNQITLNPNTPTAQPLGDFLKQATQILVDRQAGSITLPEKWSAVAVDRHERMVSHIRDTLMNRVGELTAGEGRFEEQGRQYRMRTFIRVKRPDGCPPKLIWSDYSNPFTIAAWYESGDMPPVKVVLPDILNANALAQIKPNVAFSVPPSLFNLLKNNSADSLVKGEGNPGDENGIAWICAFSIPAITLCAYIVLNIFLQLFNLIFQWLFWIKICIPIPKKLFK